MTSRILAEDLPSGAQLYDAPQLGTLALLQTALRIAPTQIDLHDSNVRPLDQLLLDCPDNLPASLLGQLIIDRCRELSELITAYRTALRCPTWAPPTDDRDLCF
jgi:hypothetical protein